MPATLLDGTAIWWTRCCKSLSFHRRSAISRRPTANCRNLCVNLTVSLIHGDNHCRMLMSCPTVAR